jgi:peptidyl-prolyl cis-trans isomerase D
MTMLKNLSGKKLGGLILIGVIIIAFGFGGFGGGFSTNNQNNIVKINKKNVTTQDFMNYLNESRVSQQAIRENIDNNIIEELLSGLISTTLISLEVEELDLSITELTVLKKIKENKNFLDENNVFQRTKYEKFLLTSNMSAPMYELQLKNKELQKHLFDFIGAGTITPEFLLIKKFEEENKSLNLKYFPMENFYKKKKDLTNLEIENFLEENKDLLKREYIDFKYVTLNPQILIGLKEFNQDFFDEIDKIENKISQGVSFEAIIENINANALEIKEYAPSATKKLIEDMIYSKRSSEIDIIENGDNFLLYTITNKYDRGPDLTDQNTDEEIRELVHQKSKFDFNRDILEEIQKKEFNDNKFNKMASNNAQYLTIKSINDHDVFEVNSVKLLYSLPENSFTLVNNKENKIYLVKLTGSSKKLFDKTDENYLKFISNQFTKDRMAILKSYDQLLNEKYQVQLNQKTIDRVKNYFK